MFFRSLGVQHHAAGFGSVAGGSDVGFRGAVPGREVLDGGERLGFGDPIEGLGDGGVVHIRTIKNKKILASNNAKYGS